MAQQDKYPLTTNALQMWINKSIRMMQKNLDADRSNNIGTLRQSLGQNFNDAVDEKGGIISGLISAVDYWYYVDEGRKPGKYPPYTNEREGILHWVLTKIPKRPDITDQSLAFLIARKIAKKGTKPTYFASEVLTEQAIDQLNEEIAETLAQDIANQFEE